MRKWHSLHGRVNFAACNSYTKQFPGRAINIIHSFELLVAPQGHEGHNYQSCMPSASGCCHKIHASGKMATQPGHVTQEARANCVSGIVGMLSGVFLLGVMADEDGTTTPPQQRGYE
ncbi:hypothetical protein ACOMHN_048897 [Nucella lapillus]